ncbi:hypothetical protein C9439_01545 [archaeon SCG-AAA382B04]|nr:hypothetical protein C9439_01545 [archaeon SCG-AAA382B04]
MKSKNIESQKLIHNQVERILEKSLDGEYRAEEGLGSVNKLRTGIDYLDKLVKPIADEEYKESKKEIRKKADEENLAFYQQRKLLFGEIIQLLHRQGVYDP